MTQQAAPSQSITDEIDFLKGISASGATSDAERLLKRLDIIDTKTGALLGAISIIFAALSFLYPQVWSASDSRAVLALFTLSWVLTGAALLFALSAVAIIGPGTELKSLTNRLASIASGRRRRYMIAWMMTIVAVALVLCVPFLRMAGI